jgi:hypothetical protein
VTTGKALPERQKKLAATRCREIIEWRASEGLR